MITKEEYQKTLIRMWDSVRQDNYEKGKLNCYGVQCEKCPMHPVCSSGGSKFANVHDAIEFVEKWGKEHPVKTNYEVLAETLKEKFGDTLNLNVLNAMINERGCELLNRDCDGNCNTCDQHDFWDKEYKEV